jgi:radical SAM protein with 4Fe4S-binding SPASM domain
MKVFYIKTTETCNLNCSHCFTSGIHGRKIFFNPEKTADFVNEFIGEKIHIDFHGGEPFLAPLEDMYKFHKIIDAVFGCEATFGATSNLTYKLSQEKIDFMTKVLNKRIATSWDEGIRWKDKKQYQLWKKNVKELISRGFEVKVFISMNTALMLRNPKDILDMLKDLGIREVAFERLTVDGSAIRNPDIFPTNKEVDDWIYEMSLVNDRDYFDNVLLESIYAKFETGDNRQSTFCRECEKFMYTVNADGTIAGCPNSAPTAHYAHIEDDILDITGNESRSCMIVKESYIDPRCIKCPVFGECGGDCYKLQWDTQCPAPKKLMTSLKESTEGKVGLNCIALDINR